MNIDFDLMINITTLCTTFLKLKKEILFTRGGAQTEIYFQHLHQLFLLYSGFFHRHNQILNR